MEQRDIQTCRVEDDTQKIWPKKASPGEVHAHLLGDCMTHRNLDLLGDRSTVCCWNLQRYFHSLELLIGLLPPGRSDWSLGSSAGL